MAECRGLKDTGNILRVCPSPLPEHPLHSQGKWVVSPKAYHSDDTFSVRSGV